MAHCGLTLAVKSICVDAATALGQADLQAALRLRLLGPLREQVDQQLLALAIDGEPGLQVDLRELDRDGPSYSVDTLRAVRAEYGDAVPVALLIGADSLLGLPTWREWTALFGLAHLVVAERSGSALDLRLPPVLAEATAGRWVDSATALRGSPAGRLLRLQQPLHPGSATEVRHRIAGGGPWHDLVPGVVADYIIRHRLYGLNGAATPASL